MIIRIDIKKRRFKIEVQAIGEESQDSWLQQLL